MYILTNSSTSNKGVFSFFLAKYFVFENYFVKKHLLRLIQLYGIFLELDFLKIEFKVEIDFAKVEFYTIS